VVAADAGPWIGLSCPAREPAMTATPPARHFIFQFFELFEDYTNIYPVDAVYGAVPTVAKLVSCSEARF